MATYIAGAGGIGCSVGYALRSAGEDVTFVDSDAAKVDWGNRHGVRVGEREPLRAEFVHFDSWNPQSGDRVWLCVKCFDNAAVLAKLPEGVEIIPVQNGYDSTLDERNHAMEGIASFVARCEIGKAHAFITRPGDLHLGGRTMLCLPERGVLTPRASLASASLARGVNTPRSEKRELFTVKHVEDIRPIKASKLMYNAAISPLAAAAGIDNGELLSDPVARRLFFALLQENYAILKAAKVPLGKVGPFHPRTVSRILRTPGLANLMAKFFVRSLRGTYCSMAGDIERGRTELENYTGHLLRLAGETVPAPLNRAVYDLISQLKKPDRNILTAIRDAAAEHS